MRPSSPSAGVARQAAGREGEDLALAWLQRQGLRLAERNFRCRTGEIDLVMQDGEVLVFVEVRRRAGRSYGGAAASVTPAKQRRLLSAAEHYLLRYRAPPACRFDVVAIDGAEISWLKNAIDR